ncbi:MAG: hypothetical protein LUQ04_00030 [Methanoregula sp.]|nr:hypothetical protein [Methanoregula sp.]
MGNPYLNRNESIILTTHNVRFGSIVTELILTSQRLILFDTGHPQFRFQTIPLLTIETVIPGEDAQGSPNISLSISAVTPDSAPQSKELVFSRMTSGERTQERDKWVKHLKEQIAAVRREALLSPRPPSQKAPDIIFEETKTTGVDRVPAVNVSEEISPAPPEPVFTPPYMVSETDTGSTEGLPEKAFPLPESEGSLAQDDAQPAAEKSPLSSPVQPPPDSSNKVMFIAVTAIIIIVIGIAVGLVYSPVLQVNPTQSQVLPTMTPAATTIVPTSAVQQTPTIQVTAEPTNQPIVLIPERGVWVKVDYAGNFTGGVGTSGDVKMVNASGMKYYQLPVTEGVVEVTIQKQDGSGDLLTVEVYKNGRMLARSTKATPFGTIDIRVDLKEI